MWSDADKLLRDHLAECARRGDAGVRARELLAAACERDAELRAAAVARRDALAEVIAARGVAACAITARDHAILAGVLGAS